MAQNFGKSYGVKLPKSQHEVEEFAAGKGGLVICKTCNAVHYKKHWHRSLEKLNDPEILAISRTDKKDTLIKFVLCPACGMIKNKQYEGRVVIKNVSKENSEKLDELIEGFCRRAYELDPMHRLIELKKSPSASSGQAVWEITVTENQLANKLAQKIKGSFSGVKTKTRFAPEPSDVAEVTVEF